jgi:transcriptional regulator with GAF, ATPase, and Fis domain
MTEMSEDARKLPPDELAESFAGIARRLLAQPSVAATLDEIARMLPDTVDGCDHAGITVARGRRFVTAAASDEVARRVDAIQHDADEGPCLDALRHHEVVVVDDLGAERRWPRFSERAVAATGVLSMLAFRLFAAERTLGALNLCSRRAAGFGTHSVAVGSIFAAHAAVAVRGAEVAEEAGNLHDALTGRDVIGQAKGIVMTHLGVSADEAFEELRRASQRLNVKLREVAARVADSGQDPGDLT